MKRLPLLRRPFLARRVLDVGAGHNPFRGATHVLDLDLGEGAERGGNPLVVPRTAVLTQGRAAALPFRARAFDYVYASHVLEHVEDPEQACGELMRIASAGYIETPSPLLEQGLALKDATPPEHWYHKWFVFPAGGDRLVFEPKSPDEVARFCSCVDGQFLRDFYEAVDFSRAQHCLRRKAKTTMFYWKGAFAVEVRKETGDCGAGDGPCRFAGMRRMLLASCNDVFRLHRVRRLKRTFPNCARVFQRYGFRTLVIH